MRHGRREVVASQEVAASPEVVASREVVASQETRRQTSATQPAQHRLSPLSPPHQFHHATYCRTNSTMLALAPHSFPTPEPTTTRHQNMCATRAYVRCKREIGALSLCCGCVTLTVLVLFNVGDVSVRDFG